MRSNDNEMGRSTIPMPGETSEGSTAKLRVLIVEDDFASRRLLQKIFTPLAEVHVSVDGCEAVTAFEDALSTDQPYHLVCLDIMLPKLDGQDVLKEIRRLESQRGVLSTQGAKVIMVTALKDMKNVMSAYNSLCDGYVAKPITRAGLNQTMVNLGLPSICPT